MAKVTPITEHFQHFLREMKESFWGDLYQQTRQAWKKHLEAESERLRDLYSGWGWYQRSPTPPQRDYRNGDYERDFVTRFGTIRLRIARTRGKNFLPPGLEKLQRRAEEVSLLIREAFLRGISTRQVGRVVATITGEGVSAQTVSQLIRSLDEAVQGFIQHHWAMTGPICSWMGSACGCGGPAAGSGCRCWWLTECAVTARGNCWAFCAARAKARRPGRDCCRICIVAGCKPRSCS